MAQSNHEIRLSVVDKTGAALAKVQKNLDRLNNLAKGIAVGAGAGAKAAADVVSPIAKRNLDDYVKTLGVLDKRLGGLGQRLGNVAKAFDFGGKTVVGLAGINALSSALQDLPRWLGGANTTLQSFSNGLSAITSPITTVTDAIQSIGPAGVATAGGIAAATAAMMAYGPALRRAGKEAEAFAESFRGTIEVTQDIISEKTLRDALSAATAEQKKLSAGTSEYTKKTEEVLAIQRELTAELRRQETVLNMVNRAQVQIGDTVRKNINASREARKVSGFADFSQRAGAQTAIDKSIRRHRERQARIAQKTAGPVQVAAAPLMLPSSEMLQATERGIFRIAKKAEVFPKIAEDTDRIARTGNNNIKSFIEGLKRGVDVSSELPRIFELAGKALEEMNKGLKFSTPQSRATQAADRVSNTVKLQALQTKNILEGNYGLKTRFALYQQLLQIQVDQLKIAKEHRKEAIRRRDAIRDIRKARRKQFREDLMLGAGFPLLTGQGPGGVLGGVAGAVIGQGRGGFGAQIFFSALGAQLDVLGGNAIRLGQALDPLSGDIEAVADAAGLANTSTKAYLTSLKGQISNTELASIAAESLAVVVGKDGVAALRGLGDETTRLGQEASKAFTAIAAALAPLLTGVIGPLATGIERLRLLSRADELGKDDPAIAKASKQRTEAIFRGVGPNDIKGLEQQRKDVKKAETTLLALIRKKEAAETAALQAKIQGLGADTIGLKILKNQNTIKKAGGDLTNKAVQDAKEENLFLQKRKSIIALNNNEKLTAAQRETEYNKIIQTFDNNRVDLTRDIADAKQRALDNADREAKQTKRAADLEDRRATRLEERLAQQQTAANQLTNSLQDTLDTTKVTGSIEEQRLKIEQDYAATLVSINQLKNQEQAVTQRDLADQIKQSRLANLRAETERSIAASVREAAEPIRSIREQHEISLQTQKEYSRLLQEGLLPADAKRIAQFNEQVSIQLQQKEEAIAITQADILRAEANGATTDELQEQLDLLKKQKKAVEDEAKKGSGVKPKTDGDIIQGRIDELRGELNEMTKLGNVVVKVADSIGSAFSTAFQDVINGSKSTQEALADMFKSVGEDFVAMAAEIIVKQLTMIALQAILKALGGPSFGGGGGTTPPQTLPGGSTQTGLGLNINGVDQGIRPVGTAANGGPVRGGSPYLVGERGPELFVPGTNGGILRNEDLRSAMSRQQSSAPAMNFSFETTNIGGTEYVSREQLEAAMAVTRKQAASDGAKRGMNMTLDKMQHSPATRRRVGI